MIPATSGLLDPVNLQAYWKTQPRSHSHCQLATIAALRLPAAMKVALLVVALSCALPWAKPRCAAGMPDQVWSVLHRQLHGWPHVCRLVVFLAASGHQAIYFQQLPSRHMAGTLGSADCPAAGLGPATAPASGTNALAAAVSRDPVQVCCRRKHWHIVLPPLPACDERWRPWNHRTLQCQLLGGDGAGSNTVLKSAGANFIGDVSSRQQVALPAGLAPLPCMPLCARIHHIASPARAAAAASLLPAAAMATRDRCVLPCSLTFWPRLQPRQLFRHGWPQHR